MQNFKESWKRMRQLSENSTGCRAEEPWVRAKQGEAFGRVLLLVGAPAACSYR